MRAETETRLARDSKGDTGVVWVRTRLQPARREVLAFYRWVMVNKREPATPQAPTTRPRCPRRRIARPARPVTRSRALRCRRRPAASRWWGDYEPGERIAHPQGITIEEAEHQMATRLYQNTARVHFNQHQQQASRSAAASSTAATSSRRARALVRRARERRRHGGVNGGSHTNPTFAGDTLFAWTDVLERIDLGRADAGALRLRLVAVKNVDPSARRGRAQDADEDGRERYDPNVVLDLDYVALIPKRAVASA